MQRKEKNERKSVENYLLYSLGHFLFGLYVLPLQRVGKSRMACNFPIGGGD
jgi:hypothetical protein